MLIYTLTGVGYTPFSVVASPKVLFMVFNTSGGPLLYRHSWLG